MATSLRAFCSWARPATRRRVAHGLSCSKQPGIRRRTVELSMLSLLASPAAVPQAAPAAQGGGDAAAGGQRDADAPLLDTAGGMKGRSPSDDSEAPEAQQLMPEASREGEAEDSGSDSESDSSSSSSSSDEEEGGMRRPAATRRRPQQQAAAAGQAAPATDEGRAAELQIRAQMEADRRAAKQRSKQAERAAKEQRRQAERAAKAQRKEERRLEKAAAAARAEAEAEAAAHPGRHSPSEFPYPRATAAQLQEEEEHAGGKGAPLSWLLGQLLR